MRHRQRRVRKGESAQDPSGKIMAPWTFDVKFPHVTQFTFRSFTFVTEEDGNFKMLPLGPAPKRLTPVYGQAPCLPTISSTPGGVCSGLNPYVGPYIRTAKLVQGILVVTSILQSSTAASSSSSSVSSLDQDSADNYPEIGGSTCGDSVEEGCLIVMVALAGGPSHNSSADIPPSGDQKCPMLGRPIIE
jgi:hypothetical protein